MSDYIYMSVATEHRTVKSIGTAFSLFIFLLSVIMTASVPVVIVLGRSLAQNLVVSATVTVIAIAIVTAAYLLGAGYEWSYLDFNRLSRKTVGISFVGGLVLLFVQILLTQLVSAAGIDVETTLYPDTDTITFFVFGLITISFVPVAEEVFYRNIIQKHLERSVGAVSAITVASVLFALSHIFNHISSSALTIGGTLGIIFAQGCVLGYLFYITKNTTVAVLAHALNNAAVFLVALHGLTL